MSTERFRRVAQLWNWLPAFRGVAEHESIQKASVILRTSPSALSRTVKLLEDALGVDLFVRRAQSLSLTTDGARLLAATRDAMRLVDDGLPAVGAGERGRAVHVHIGVTSPTAGSVVALALVTRVVRDLDLRIAVTWQQEVAAVDALVRGALDLVVTPSALFPPELVVERAGETRMGVYAARGHALASSGRAPSDAELASVPFVAREGNDGWPAERPRNVVASIPSLDGVLAFCADAGAVTALADLVAARIAHGSLVRLCDAGPPQVFYALRRKPLDLQGMPAVDTIVEALRSCLSGEHPDFRG